MIFLNPLFLVGLGAAAIPIIIHLLNLRKVRTIEFSTLSFLKELQRTQIRRIKLRQLILLILRTLLIIFIVLAFSRPAIQTAGGVIGADANTTAAILLDNSASMDVYNEHGNVFRQATDYALETIDLLTDGDNVILLRQSDIPDATTSATANLRRVRTIISETQPHPVHRNFNQGIVQAHTLLQESPHLNRELYIISDMQASHWNNDEIEVTQLFDDSYRAFVIPLAVDQFNNAGIHNISFRSTLFESGKQVTLDVEIRNHGDTDLDNHLASVYLNEQRVAQKAVDIGAGSRSVVDFSITPEQPGTIEGYIELEDDALEIDNRYYFTIAIPEQLNVLLVAPDRDDVRYIEIALAARGDGTEDASAIRTNFVSADNIAAEDLSEYQSVIAVNVPSFSDAQVDRITRYVEQGGGFIVFPGDNIDIQNYNRGLLSKLQMPDIQNISGRDGEQTGALAFDHVDYDHPIFQDIFEERLRERAVTEERIESPRIRRSLETGSVRSTDTPVITLSNGQEFLISGQRENGTVLMYSIHPTMQWSDFPIRGIFVPLIHRSLLYATAMDHNNDRFIAGDAVTVSIPATEAGIQADHILVAPDGTEERIQPQHLAAAGVLQYSFDTVEQTGVYRIKRNDMTVRAFAVNVHPGESTGERIDNETVENRLQEFGLQNIYFVEQDDDFAVIVQESRYGQELWKLFAILAFLMALIETVLARDPKQQAAADQQKLS